MALGSILSEFVLPVAVLISAAATTSTAVLAWKLYGAVLAHERALFGEERVEGHDGIIEAVNENTERSEVNRRVLKAHDLVPSTEVRPPGAWQDNGTDDEQRGTA